MGSTILHGGRGGVVDRPTQLICISDRYLLSWRWRPLWSGGTLYQWSPWLKKASWVRFFLSQNICVLYKPSVKRQETGQKPGRNPPNKAFLSAFLLNSAKVAATFEEFLKGFAEFHKNCHGANCNLCGTTCPMMILTILCQFGRLRILKFLQDFFSTFFRLFSWWWWWEV